MHLAATCKLALLSCSNHNYRSRRQTSTFHFPLMSTCTEAHNLIRRRQGITPFYNLCPTIPRSDLCLLFLVFLALGQQSVLCSSRCSSVALGQQLVLCSSRCSSVALGQQLVLCSSWCSLLWDNNRSILCSSKCSSLWDNNLVLRVVCLCHSHGQWFQIYSCQKQTKARYHLSSWRRHYWHEYIQLSSGLWPSVVVWKMILVGWTILAVNVDYGRL